MIDRWWEPTGQEPSLEGDEAGGDDEDMKDVPPDSYSQCGRSNEGSRCPALIYTISAAGLTAEGITNAEKDTERKLMLKRLACMLRQTQFYQDRMIILKEIKEK